MILFVLTIFPMSLIIFYLKKDRNNRAFFLPIIFTGFFTGVLYLAYKLLFSTFYHIPQANIFANFIYYLIFQAIIPIVAIYGLFFLFARKDTIEDRFSFFFPLIASFYSVFLPYMVLETQKPYPGFLLFIKPLMFLAMFIIIQIYLSKLLETKGNSKETAKKIGIIILALCIPAFVESLWVVNVFPLFWIIPATLIILFAAYLIIP